ncbi:MAG: ribosome maturation factor RimP [Coxiella sp. (in: Bacteria)]|nr:MAG: ribosome maturation factor RimP [Coxiella sp. (in: g-proteobacteria)]
MQNNKLVDIITPAIEALGLELWGCELLRHAKKTELWVYVEGKNGITLGECARVSRQVSAVLDVEDPISSAYQLQVSSPGMDRILFKPEQYQRYLNTKLKVRMRVALDGKRNFNGVLVAADAEKITMQCGQDDEVQLQFNQIEKAQVVPEI